MLRIINLTKKYGMHTALNQLNLTVKASEIFCLLGANGAGKTRAINLFMNFIQPTSGQVFINDLGVGKQAQATRKHFVYISENLNLFFQWLFVIFGYTLICVLCMAGIIALKKGTAMSAMLGLGFWLFTTLIMPALLNLFIAAQEPRPNQAEVIHTVRAANDQYWDSPKSFVVNKFYEDRRQYAQADSTHFHKWYNANFLLLDKEANAVNNQFAAQIHRRNALLKKWEWLAPAAMVYEYLSNISKTNRNRECHFQFVEATHDFHDQLKTIYYSKIFAEEKFSQQNLKRMQTLQKY